MLTSTPPATGEPMPATEIQAVLVGILREVDRICRASGIPYCLIGGGCLGIARHGGGFVPWDDDLDLAVWASDMPRFVEAMATLPAHLAVRVKSDGANPAYHVMDVRTRTVGSGYAGDVGVFIDVLPMMLWRSPAWKRLDRALERVRRLGVHEGSPPLSNAIKRLLVLAHVPRLAAGLCERLFYPLVRRQDAAGRRAGRGVITAAYGRSWIGCYDHDTVLPLQEAAFCGQQVFVPRDVHGFLRQRYGPGYMQPPPEADRGRHFSGAFRVSQG
jgi:lipopolysaccharide cholinephosphotransferase